MNFEIVLLLRLLVAGFCGGVIGLEREYRAKEAGLRTHFLVCLGSSLFMVVSQYGFTDNIVNLMNVYGPQLQVGVDTSRVAAQVVSGIGFIGAGMIVLQKRFIVGLTTAAGLWTTAAIGMAVGAGLYGMALATTLLTLAGFELLGRVSRRMGRVKRETLVVFYADSQATAEVVTEELSREGRSITSYSSARVGDRLHIRLSIDTPERTFNAGKVLAYLQKHPGVETESVD